MAGVTRYYWDYAATAPLRPEARAAMLAALDAYGNPSSVHAEGQQARAILDDCRRAMGEILDVRAERIVLTSGGTEANNLAIKGSAANGRVLVSALEHDCVLQSGAAVDAELIPALPDGTVDLAALAAMLKKGGVGLVSVMHANNETGVIQPVEEIARLAHGAGAAFHTDAVQTVGHIPLEVDAIGADLLSFSAHKFGGPKGIGALVVKNELSMQALLHGGAQERNRRAGTENLPAVAGMAAALGTAMGRMHTERAEAEAIAEALEAGLPAGITMVAPDSPKVPHVRQLLSAGRKGEDVVIALDVQGFSTSQGSACSSGRVQASHVLQAMGMNEAASGEGLRLSWGWASRRAEVAPLLEALARVTA